MARIARGHAAHRRAGVAGTATRRLVAHGMGGSVQRTRPDAPDGMLALPPQRRQDRPRQMSDPVTIRAYRPGDEHGIVAGYNAVSPKARSMAHWQWKLGHNPVGRVQSA